MILSLCYLSPCTVGSMPSNVYLHMVRLMWPHKKQWLALPTTIPTIQDIDCSACNLVIFVSNQYSSNWTDCRAQLNIFENSIVGSPGAQPSFRLISLEIKLLWICESLDSLGLCWDFPQRAISFTCRHSNLLTFQRSVLPPTVCRPITARGGGDDWPISIRIQHTDWIVRILERTAGIFDISIMLLMIHQ